MNNYPVLSFCIPTFNRAERVFACVKHILQYKGDEIEVCISDNHSQDNTIALLNTINDSRLKVYTNSNNILSSNWPLAVSYATGKWAALMSDEDIVNLEDLPDILRILKEQNLSLNVGIVKYDYPSVQKITIDGVIERLEEGFIFSLNFIHISSCIVRTAYFSLRKLSSYNWFFQNNLPNKGDETLEPQNEFVVDIAKKYKVLLTTKQLFSMGVHLESEDMKTHHKKTKNLEKNASHKDKKILIDVNTTYNPETQIRLLFATVEHIRSSELEHKDLLLMKALSMRINCSAVYINKLLCNNGFSGQSGFEFAESLRNRFSINLTTASEKICEIFDEMIRIVESELNHKSYVLSYRDCFYAVFEKKAHKTIQSTVGLVPRIHLGELLYTTLLALCNKHETANLPIKNPISELWKCFELEKTQCMFEYLCEGNYDEIILQKNVSAARASYLIGCAYQNKNDYKNAKIFFEKFIYKIEFPKLIGDILTSVSAIQYAYFSLKKIAMAEKNLVKAQEYNSKLRSVSEELLVTHNLMDRKYKVLNG